MNIAIIGAGFIGGTLGEKWAAAGHAVNYGVRSPRDPKYAGSSGLVVSISEAIDRAEVVLLSLPGPSVADFADQHGPALSGKTVIDATNNVRSPVMHSLDILAERAPAAVLVRAFSTLGGENFANPHLGGQVIDLFYCGNPAARPAAEQLIHEVGLRPIYVGDASTAPALDGMTRVWFALANNQGRGRRIAFKLLED